MFVVNFSVVNIKDFDGDEFIYEWYFDGDDKVDVIEFNFFFIFEKVGEYKVCLVVMDFFGEFVEVSIMILVGNVMFELSWDFVGNCSFYWDG